MLKYWCRLAMAIVLLGIGIVGITLVPIAHAETSILQP